MHQDNAFHVVVSEGRVFFGSSVDNTVRALDVATGRIEWTYYTEGPVRFAPALCEGRVYFGSDDGYVYCVGASDGSLRWKHRPGPGADKAIGNGRVISCWPVRTSILVDDGAAFACAGVFPFEGIYVCALKADDGALIWKNDTIGDRAHDLEYGGISPQGYLLASEDALFVPSGRAMPAAFDRKTGEFLYYASPGAKRGGTWALLDQEQLVAGVDHSGRPEKIAFDPKTGGRRGAHFAWFPGLDMAVTAKRSYILTEGGVKAVDRAAYAEARQRATKAAEEQKRVRADLAKLKKAQGSDLEIASLSNRLLDLDGKILDAKMASSLWSYERKDLCALILAGDTVFAGGGGFVAAVDAKKGEALWTHPVEGKAAGLAAADGYLFVSTDRGLVYCFGDAKNAAAGKISTEILSDPYPRDEVTELYRSAATEIVERSHIRKGFCLIPDCLEGRLAFELARRTDLKIVGLERDAKKRERAREKLSQAGLLGSRVVVEDWKIDDLPPYFANLIVSDRMVVTGLRSMLPRNLERVQRPCGGIVMTCAASSADARTWRISRRGPLRGAGAWTQLYADPENTACSKDELVKGPFGVLWYGEPGSENIVDRHGRACGPVSMNGRLFHQGEEMVMAYDAYNGTFLWKREIPGAVRVRVDVDGGNLALTEEALYVAVDDACHCLNPATGETDRIFKVPPSLDGSPRRWGYVAAQGDVLFGTAAFPLMMEYAAAWKDFVDSTRDQWKTPEEISPEIFDAWGRTTRFKNVYADYKARYSVPDKRLYQDFQRAGTLWHPMADFPAWDSQRTPRGALTGRLMAGDALFAMEGSTGELLWIHRGGEIPNISVSMDKESIYFADSASEEEWAAAFREKQELIAKGNYEEGKEAALVKDRDRDVRLVQAIDAATGKVRWKKPLDLTGCGGDKMGSAVADGVLLFFGHFSNHDTGFFLGNELTWRRIVALDAGSGEVLWSRPLNYLRRPLVVGETVIIEPRACDLFTGEIKTRPHPISARPVPWEFLRPGHCCAVTSASAHTLFYRSFFGAIYELTGDKGLSLFGAIRPGCWLNMISAGGLMLMPEASAGCTCSFPLRCSLALVSRPERVTGNWTVFITHGPSKPVKHLAVNFGAPGDKRDDEGRVWLAWPRPKVVSPIGYPDYAMPFELEADLAPGGGFFQKDFRGVHIEGTKKPWLFVSGCRNVRRLTIPLIDSSIGGKPGLYTVRLGFVAPPGDSLEDGAFSVAVQGEVRLRDIDFAADAGGPDRVLIHEVKGIHVDDALVVEFLPTAMIHCIEILREDVENLPDTSDEVGRISPAEGESMLDMAKALRDGGARDDALALYHEIFSRPAPAEYKVRALEALAALADPASISYLKESWTSSRSILTDYKPVDPEVQEGAVRAGLAVAMRLAGEDPDGALELLGLLSTVLSELTDPSFKSEVAERLGYKIDWRLHGPVPWGEGQDSIAAVYAANAGAEWGEGKEYVSPAPKVDLQKALGPQDKVFAFADGEFHLDEEGEVLLKVGSDDGFKCWLNGECVGGYGGPRGWAPDQTALRVKGRKGKNTLRVLVIEQGGDWAFSVRITDRDGFPISWRRPAPGNYIPNSKR